MLVLFTDTDSDITPIVAKKYGYNLISMPYIIGDNTIKPYEDFELFEYESFYNLLRQGTIPTTCAINAVEYVKYFEPFFKNGDDILYVHFSKAMSGTFNALNIALEELKEKYPERKFYMIDTKGITINEYISVLEIGELYKKGTPIEEIIKWADENVDKCATYFYADDLKFFGKSGRISNFSAIMGGMLGIKPIIYMDQNGQMTSLSKAKGRVGTLKKILSIIVDLQEDIKNHPVIIGHSDCLDIAELMGKMLKDTFGQDLNIEYVVVNPTAGSHCGPDCIGVAFHAKHR